jgi:hypothetical protein
MERDPIQQFIARALRERCVMASELDAGDFVLVRVVERGARPSVFAYEHLLTGRRVHVDDRGRAYRRTGDRLVEHRRLTHAVWELEPLLIRAARTAALGRRHLRLVR